VSPDKIRRVQTVLGLIRDALRALFERWPALPVAAALIIGIAIASSVHTGFLPLLLTALIILCGGLLLSTHRGLATVCLLSTLLLVGILTAQWHQYYFASNDIARFITADQRLAQMRLQITSPQRTIERATQRWQPSEATTTARVTELLTKSGWQPCTGDISVSLYRPIRKLEVGQTIQVTGFIEPPAPASNPGEFDLAAYCRDQRILANVRIMHPDAVTILSPGGFHPIEYLRRQARRMLEKGFTPAERPTYALLQAVVLGDHEVQMRDAQQDFAAAGGAYLLAISGLHILLVGAAVWIFLGRIVGVHPRWATVGAMVVVLLYSLIVVPGAPSIRATTLFLAFGTARLMQRRVAYLQLLSLCAIGILTAEPQELHNAGFQLSFLTVAGLIIGAKPLVTFLTNLVEDEHTRVARSFRPPGFWGTAWLLIRNWFIQHFAVCIVAWLVSMPLVMIHFRQVNPWGLLASFILLPLLAIVLIGGLIKILVTLLVPALALSWAHLIISPITLLRHVVHFLAQLPGASLFAARLSPLLVVFAYALLLVPRIPWTSLSVRRVARCFPLVAVGLVCLPALFGFGFSTSAIPETRVTLLAIGAGQIGIIELPDHRAVLVDDGSTTITDPLRRTLVPYLQTRDIRNIDAMFLSHPDYDHISAAAATVQTFNVPRVYLNPVFQAQSVNNPTARYLLRRLAQMHTSIEIIHQGERISLTPEDSIDVLWPPDHRSFTSTNNAGLVLKLTYHNRSVLFPADIQAPTEDALLADASQLHADLLVAPHHGSAENSTAAFLKAVHPAVVFSSNSKRLSGKQRDFDRIAVGYRVYRTSTYGAITVHLSSDGEFTIETFLHPRP
jgi:competence protein ComEC